MNHRPKILSIDDNDRNQKLIEKALAGTYEVQTAMSGSSGIEILTRFHPDAILLDVDMPYLDGLRLCRMIRAEPSFSSTPVIFVSAMDSHLDQVRGYQAGGDDYLIKPINLEQLMQRLDQTLSRARSKHDAPPPSNDAPALEQSTTRLLDALVELIGMETAEEVGQHALATLDSLGLKGAVYLHDQGKIFSSIGPLSDLEALLLQQATLPYPSEFSARYLWGSASLGAIIQNMPHAHYERYQPLVQLIGALLKGADQKLRALPQQLRATSRKTHLPKNKWLDLNNLHIHRYKIEAALEEMEQRSEQQLSQLCQKLQEMSRNNSIGAAEAQQLAKLAELGLATRLTVYDQCQEIQLHFNRMSDLVEQREAIS